MFKKQSLWCQKIENLLPTCLMCRHTTYRMHDRPDRTDCECHMCIFFVDVRDKWSSFDMNIPTWNAQSKVGNQRCEKWQTLDTESATNFWMTFIMQAQRPSELNMLSTRRNINILIILFWCVLGVLYATEKLKYSELIRQRWREIETNTKKNQPRYWTTRFWWTNESKKKL